MSEQVTCYDCGKVQERSPSDLHRMGRPTKYFFCSRLCYKNHRRKIHNGLKVKLLPFIRSVWGTTEMAKHDVGKARKIGRIAELKCKQYLAQEGFEMIADLSEKSNQFYIDFICIYQGQRVLVDATIKIKAHVPEKVFLANALGLDLYIIHVSPSTENLYYIQKMKPGVSGCRLPMAFIHSLMLPKPNAA
jgi:hypothetical protein